MSHTSETRPTPTTGSAAPRALGWALLLAAGILSLPVAAGLFDGQGSENWVLPAQLVGMAVVGALVGIALPGFTHGTTGRRAAVGAACGVAMAIVGVLVFFLLLSGFDGA